MTTLRHHPHDETLMSFAAGVLDPAMSLVRSCHLQFLCDVPPPIVENIGGVLLERIPSSDEDPAFLDRTVRPFSQQFAHEVGIASHGPSLDAGNEVIMPGRIARATGLRRETTPWNFEAADLRRFDLSKLAAPKRLPTSSTSPLEGSFPPQKNGG